MGQNWLKLSKLVIFACQKQKLPVNITDMTDQALPPSEPLSINDICSEIRLHIFKIVTNKIEWIYTVQA